MTSRAGFLSADDRLPTGRVVRPGASTRSSSETFLLYEETSTSPTCSTSCTGNRLALHIHDGAFSP